LRVTFRAAHYRVYARHQFILVERLGHVIVGAEAKPPDLVLDTGEAGEDQNGRFHFRHAQAAEHLKTGHVRQIEVEKNDVVVVDFSKVDAFFSEIRRVNVEALGFEHQFDRLRGRAIVFDQQYAHASPLFRRTGSRSARRGGGPWKNAIDKLIRDTNDGMVNKT